MSWQTVHEIIKSLCPDDFAADENVRSFVQQYIKVVKRIIHPGERSVEKLLDKYRHTLEKLSEKNGAAAIGPMDESRRESLKELIKAFRQKPAEQCSEIEGYLKSKGLMTTRTGRGSARWLTWESREGVRALKTGWSLNWSVGFYPGVVRVTLEFPSRFKGTAKENVVRFMKKNPIERWLPPSEADRFIMENPDKEFGSLIAYRNNLLDSKNLTGLSFRESTKLLREKLDEFFARGSDYDRIETYFACLAFDAREGMPEDAERQRKE
jgi:hypothetical protein